MGEGSGQNVYHRVEIKFNEDRPRGGLTSLRILSFQLHYADPRMLETLLDSALEQHGESVDLLTGDLHQARGP